MADKRIVVVGGGISGLAAAYAAAARARELGRALSVTVLEKSGRFGGNLVTEKVDGFVLDGGPDSWLATKTQATELACELGLSNTIIGTNPEARRYYVAWAGALHRVPEGLVLGVPTRLGPLAKTPLFTWRGKLRMAMEPFVRARRFDGDEDESVASFAARRLGREAAERLVAPLLGGISSGDASGISIRAAFPQLVAMEREHGSLVRAMRRGRGRSRPQTALSPGAGSAFLSLRGGVGDLVAALVDQLGKQGVALEGDSHVEALARRPGGGWGLALGAGRRVEADAVVIAAPAHAATRLLSGLDEALPAELSRVVYGSTTTVFLGYRRGDIAHPLDGVGFVVPAALGRPILASTWVSSKWSGRAPEGHVLVRIFLGGAFGRDILSRDDASIVRLARQEQRALLNVDPEPLFARVFRFASASAQMRVGHLATMRTVHARLGAVAPGVRLVGGGYGGVGIPDCVGQGREAGHALADEVLVGKSTQSPRLA